MNQPKKTAQRREMTGVVVSDKMTKTVVISVERKKMNTLYHKQFKVTTKYKAHDPKGVFHVGDKVTVYQIRPISKDKRWMVVYAENKENI